MRKNKKKKAFTLVELLAVIVILAIILIIAIPQIMSTIDASRLGAMEDSAKLIAKNAEQNYISQKTINDNYNGSGISCNDVAKLDDNYSSCSITYDSNGIATVKLKGSNDGKFSNIKCTGTKDNMSCTKIEPLEGYSDAVEYLTQKYNNGTNSEGLIQTNGTELRYQGSNPNNYVYFNCTDNTNPTSSTCEVWRIIGVFGDRVKLVRKDSIGSFSWDSSESTTNAGLGINQWGPSGTYEGADLMRELNGDYLDSTLSANANWYNGRDNKKEGVFNKDYVLKENAQELIGDALWYTGGILVDLGGVVSSTTISGAISLEEAYAAERGTQDKICSGGSTCTDRVLRTYTWTGKVGLIYPSDFGYASGNNNCATNMSFDNRNCYNNWMASYGITITSAHNSVYNYCVWELKTNSIYSGSSGLTNAVRPSVYLIPGIQIKGSGTTSDPYVFAE